MCPAVAAGGVVTKAEELDEKFGVRTTITGAVAAVTERVVGLDKSLGVSETAFKVDEKVSGGMGASLLNKGLEIVNSSVEYVTDALNHAKVTAAAENSGSDVVTSAEAVAEVAPTPAAPVAPAAAPAVEKVTEAAPAAEKTATEDVKTA